MMSIDRQQTRISMGGNDLVDQDETKQHNTTQVTKYQLLRMSYKENRRLLNVNNETYHHRRLGGPQRGLHAYDCLCSFLAWLSKRYWTSILCYHGPRCTTIQAAQLSETSMARMGEVWSPPRTALSSSLLSHGENVRTSR